MLKTSSSVESRVIFKVFRFHGYNLSSGKGSLTYDENGKFKASDIKGIISLLEAAQFRINGEAFLDEALSFTKPELQSIASQSIDPHLLNTLWWKEENMASKFPYMRHILVEVYLRAVGYYFEPRYARARYMYTKLAMMWELMDDTNDAYATFE
ncbi:hypothetical protein F3Y22_tig00005465pilonHSYRG00162 [Hibiscus syriacus]|uniref:Uncharacterized protein n=1 Tax=Hibiscus syriacus TaxID=106335 RepID=A0A6A3CIV6_HIBSY|nr:hypothetical protein F3Y22_tig00005465pilonHSYRG00162 [Hibiscus syriacus]